MVGMTYFADLDLTHDYHVEVSVPVDVTPDRKTELPPPCRVAPAATTASALHQAPYSEMQMTSACLFDWVAEHDLPLTGQFGETYLVDERDTDDLEDFRTLVSLGITAIPATVSECGRSTTGHTHPSPP
jgi:effector-binding domain-containing protein